jgi:hypothetical protein
VTTTAGFDEALTAWSGFALALFAAAALVGTAISIHHARQEARRARTYEYMRRLFATDFMPLVTRTRVFLQSGAEDRSKPTRDGKKGAVDRARARFEKMKPSERAEIILVLNFFEEMSGTYQAGLLDREIAANMLAPFAIQLWREAEWFIQDRRRETRQLVGSRTAMRTLDRWEALVNELSDRG